MMQDMNSAMVLMSWEAFSLARPGCSVAEYLCWSGRNSLYSVLLFRLNVTFATLFRAYVILATAFNVASYCVSFGFPFCEHPSRCLRCPLGVLNCASDEVPCYVHPSRCCVLCILRGALLCASFEVLCFVHCSRCLVMCILRGVVFCFLEKRLPPS